MTKTTILIVSVLLIMVLCCGTVFGGYLFLMGRRNTAIDYETRLLKAYNAGMNQYSSCNASKIEGWGAIAAGLQGFDVFMSDAVKGRYDNKDASGNPTGVINVSVVTKAIQEQYPEIASQVDLIKNFVAYTQVCRDKFKNNQDAVIDISGSYDKWGREFPNKEIMSIMGGVPTQDLVVMVGQKEYRGADALRQMRILVLTSDTVNAYQTGVDTPFVPQLNPTAAPTKRAQ